MFKFLDIVFVVFHTCLIVFNLFGWIWKPTRKASLITLLLTGGSWFIMGIFYGIGYCPLTDWHWDILRKLEVTGLPNSYIQYLLERILSVHFSAKVVDSGTALAYFLALFASFYVNFNRQLKKTFRNLFPFILFIFIIGCDEEVHVISPSNDVPIAYCILDVNDTIHYLRITKSAVDQLDAYDIIRDSTNLYYENIEAQLNEYLNDAYVQSFEFELSDITDKEPGEFPLVPNSIYQFEAKLNAKARYELVITIPGLDTIRSETLLVRPFLMNTVNMIYITEEQPYFFKWTSPVNGKYYELKIQYHLIRNYNGDVRFETKEFIIGTSTSFNTEGGEKISLKFPVSNYEFIKEEYLSDTLVPTVLQQIDIEFTAATEELLIYRNSATSLNSGMTERTIFSNIHNGYGIFSSRLIRRFEDITIYIEYSK